MRHSNPPTKQEHHHHENMQFLFICRHLKQNEYDLWIIVPLKSPKMEFWVWVGGISGGCTIRRGECSYSFFGAGAACAARKRTLFRLSRPQNLLTTRGACMHAQASGHPFTHVLQPHDPASNISGDLTKNPLQFDCTPASEHLHRMGMPPLQCWRFDVH
jgi:hypothetical protein